MPEPTTPVPPTTPEPVTCAGCVGCGGPDCIERPDTDETER